MRFFAETGKSLLAQLDQKIRIPQLRWQLKKEEKKELTKELDTVFRALPPKEAEKQRQEFLREKRLFTRLEEKYQELLTVSESETLVKKTARDRLLLLKKVEQTEVYGFIKKDIAVIREKIEYIRRHPKESRVAYVLTSIYIISPGTFEATFVVLFFRYLIKYARGSGKGKGDAIEKKADAGLQDI